jgi:TPR repeat protein
MGDTTLLTRLPTRASRPSADTLFRLGLRLSTGGAGEASDPLAAHALFEVAAKLGSLEAKVYRRPRGELGPADLAEAQQAAREWLTGA